MEKTVIAAASFYNKSYYFNQKFNELPPEIKKDIKQIVVSAANKNNGVFIMGFNENCDIYLETGGLEHDLTYDEIEGKMRIRELEDKNEHLLMKLKIWARIKNTEGAEYEGGK